MVALTVTDTGENRRNPNIFLAAAEDNVIELALCLKSGQSLDDIDADTGFSPIHIAILEGSIRFLDAAFGYGFDPWKTDRNERLAIDHAAALNEKEIQQKLLERMYPRRLNKSGIVHKLEP